MHAGLHQEIKCRKGERERDSGAMGGNILDSISKVPEGRTRGRKGQKKERTRREDTSFFGHCRECARAFNVPPEVVGMHFYIILGRN
jgi:hypothetical protein